MEYSQYMPKYNWSGINNDGKKITGVNKAADKKQLNDYLIQQNILPQKITHNFFHTATLYPQIKTKHITILIEQLSSLISANTPIVRALTIISQDEPNPKIKNLIIHCKNSISDGKSLYQTLNQYPQYFNELIRNLINVGEQSGNLDIMLIEISDHLRKAEVQKHKIIKALLYPITVFMTTLIVTAILLIFVIPQFEAMYNNFGATLPSYTRAIIQLSRFLQTAWWFILTTTISAIICIKTAYHRSIKLRLTLDKITLNLPLIKTITIAATIARLTKTLNLTLKSGIPLLTAINIALTTISNRQYQLAVKNALKLIANGQPLHKSLSKQNLFPNKVIQLIMLGEETGTLDSILEKIAAIYNEELNNITDNLNNLLEPLIMLIMGAIVGGLVVGMYLPIFSLGTVI